jgi:ubiquitin-conjugating enzyme E2 Q
LPRDFIDAVATGYRPGLLRFGNDFALSVAFPVIKLARDISPQALMAWDRRLLSRSQYLTLLINGWKGVYPIIRSDGIFLEDFQRLGATLSFRVGLTKTYKPSKEHAVEEGRTFALVNDTVQDGTPIRDAAEECEDMFEGGETEDEEALEKFSLSSSLESLLDNSLLKVVQLRRKFGLGWAGAETLLSKVEGLQTSPETVFTKYRTASCYLAPFIFASLLTCRSQEIDAADKEETVLASSYRLPFDPLAGRNKDDELNLPLIAFCFLVRRLTVRSLSPHLQHSLTIYSP